MRTSESSLLARCGHLLAVLALVATTISGVLLHLEAPAGARTVDRVVTGVPLPGGSLNPIVPAGAEPGIPVHGVPLIVETGLAGLFAVAGVVHVVRTRRARASGEVRADAERRGPSS